MVRVLPLYGVTYLQQADPGPRNALTVFERNGEELFTYTKIHTCDFADFEAATRPGEDVYVETLDTEGGPVKLGAMICYDREFPETAHSPKPRPTNPFSEPTPSATPSPPKPGETRPAPSDSRRRQQLVVQADRALSDTIEKRVEAVVDEKVSELHPD